MTYLSHFHFHTTPFALTPNSDLFFPDAHMRILEAITFAAQRGEGIVKVTGDIGTGKTLLCRLLLESMAKSAAVAYLTAPHANPGHLAAHLCQAFKASVPKGEDPLLVLEKFLINTHEMGRRALLIVDEAQGLEAAGLEAIRLLSNLETPHRKLLQIVLFGQSELNHLLGSYGLRQLQQRITFSFETKAFDALMARRYIIHRLQKSLKTDVAYNIMSPKALCELVAYGRGIPRLINILADKAFLCAYGEGKHVVQEKHVRASIHDTPAVCDTLSWGQKLRLRMSL